MISNVHASFNFTYVRALKLFCWFVQTYLDLVHADLLYRDYQSDHKFTLTTCTLNGVVSIALYLSLYVYMNLVDFGLIGLQYLNYVILIKWKFNTLNPNFLFSLVPVVPLMKFKYAHCRARKYVTFYAYENPFY